MKNISIFLSENFQFLVVKFSIYLDRRVMALKRSVAKEKKRKKKKRKKKNIKVRGFGWA